MFLSSSRPFRLFTQLLQVFEIVEVEDGIVTDRTVIVNSLKLGCTSCKYGEMSSMIG